LGKLNVRILVITRLHSGFMESVANGVWSPTGAPAIYRLLNYLIECGHELHVVFTCKDDNDIFDDGQDHAVEIAGLRAAAVVLSGHSAARRWPQRIRWQAYEARQILAVRRIAKTFDPHLVYADRGNLWSAAYFARFTKFPVAYRIMGIIEALTDGFAGQRPMQRLIRWCLRSPFDIVICTQDGSGGEVWLDRMLAPNVPRRLLLNGVDMPEADTPTNLEIALPVDRTIVLLLGRLESIKGCEQFLTAFLVARARRPGQLHALIVGTGSCLESMRAQIIQNEAQDDVTIIPSLPHGDILTAHSNADIYVSLNRQGNLSNANLEAFRMGACAIVPSSDAGSGRDLALDAMFSTDVVLRVSSVDDIEAIAAAIIQLHDHPDERVQRGRQTAETAAVKIGTWNERMALELALLGEIATDELRGPDVIEALEHMNDA
jgi:glycosyltransferase involved in cell wall biosynthesis